MASYEGKDPLELAQQAERELNSHQSKSGTSGSDSTNESGVDTSVESRFPGAKVTYGSAASGAGDNREIPVEEGGDVMKDGRTTKARDFEGQGGPEEKQALAMEERGGDDGVENDVRRSIRARRD